ncbi:hypothetical protein L2725_10915 [Shewanella corallii]|uniref:Uncharacterized protein n=1 Tax=Shewanella corallii TaxID=560080 RepID=A0ABT0N730_9GAMM|nr:hypothetical protein [Shewanella corallii]MCL2914278.1 hypothetical protein [Shewanella corallii]
MEVKFGTGLDNIRFGLDQAALKSLLGEPDKIDRDKNNLPLLQYNKLKSTFWMDEGDKLHWIQCSNPELLIQGVNVIGLATDEVISKLHQIGEATYEFEDYGSMESYSFPELELEVQAEYGVVTTICFGHFWKNDEPVYTNA